MTFVVTREQAKTRLDALVRELASLSQKKAKLLCALGGVAVDGVCAIGTARVREGAEVTLATEHVELMLQLGLPVNHADDDVLVLQKPPGLPVVAAPEGESSLADALERELPGCEFAFRLDRDASGLLLVARHAEALMHLDLSMAKGEVQRTFEAIVQGSVADDEQSVELPPLPSEPDDDEDDYEEPASHARLQVFGRRDGATHLRIETHDGHSPQIRAYLQQAGHAILGDERYGDAEANDHVRATFGVHRALLHLKRLRFVHPSSGDAIDLTASDEPDFARMFPQRRNRGSAD